MCAPGQLLLSGKCTQVLDEPAYGCNESSINPNSGAFTACSTLKGQQPPHCSGAACVPGACKAGYVDCNGNPSDGCEAWMLDKATCGSCTNACAANQVCTSTGCAAACGPLESQTANGSCVNNSVCDPGQCPSPLHGTGTCVSNACAVTCDAGYTLCSGKCVDTQNDPAHCGGCNACPKGPPIAGGALACVSGTCTQLCSAGLTLCTNPVPMQAPVDLCANLQTDLQNCGACGHTCATGLCIGGVCDATQTRYLVSNVKITHLVVDAAYVYYADDTGATISRVGKTGGTPQVLVSAESNVGGLVLDGTHLYWSSTKSNAVERVPLAGGTVEVVSAASNPGVLAVDASNVFWANNSNNKLLSVPKGGGSITTFATPQNCGTLTDVQIDGIYLYWNQPGGMCDGLRRAPADGSGSVQQVFNATGPVIAFDQDYVYASDDFKGMGLMRRKKDLSEPRHVATDGVGVSSLLSFGVEGPFVYSNDGSKSGRGLKCGSAAPLASFGPPYPIPYGSPLVLDGSFVYSLVGTQLERLPL